MSGATQTDKGWAWVVLGASMGCQFLNGVLCYFVGVVHTGLLDRFQASVTTTAWVGALYSSNMCLMAPLAGVVINRYGCRVCCVAGGLLCFAGFTASAFVNSVSMLFLTYGLLAGLGLGMSYSPTVITIGYYFDKFRGLASGISVTFAAVGILSGSLIAQTLIDEYSVSGAFLLIGAVSLHFCFFGMFFRPTQFECAALSVSGEGLEINDLEKRTSKLSLALRGVEIRATSLSSIHMGNHLLKPGYGSVASLLTKVRLNQRPHSFGSSSLAGSMQNGEIFPQSGFYSATVQSVSVDRPRVPCEDCALTASEDRWHKSCLPSSDSNIRSKCSCSCDARAFVTDDKNAATSVCSSMQNLPNHCDSKVQNTDENRCTDNTASKLSSEPESTDLQTTLRSENPGNVTTVSDDTASHRLLSRKQDPPGNEDFDNSYSVTSQRVLKHSPTRPGVVKTKVLQTMDKYVRVLGNKPFMFHCASVLAANVHISGVYLHLPEYVQSHGTSPTYAAALFVAVGLLSILSRLATGFATTEPKIDPLTLNMGMMGLCGLATAIFPLFSATYGGQVAFSALFGLYTGGLYALVSVLTVHFTSLTLLPTAFGVMVFLMGVGYVSGPPLAALIVDNGGTYEHSFVFLGSMMLLGSLLDMAAAFYTESHDKEDVDNLDVASVTRDWLGSTLIVSVQETGSAHVHCEVGSQTSVQSHFS